MKTLVKNAIRLVFSVLVVSCSNDDLPTEPVELVPVEIQFGADTFYSENSQDNDITILSDKPAFEAGTITVKVISDAPLFFSINPATVNNEITIPVAKGALSAKFKFNPRDDWFIDGHKLITFELKTVTPGFTIGSKNDILIDLYDDELRWKPLSYEIVAAGNKTKRTYEYMQDGKLAKVNLQTQNSQGNNTTTYTYHYDTHDKLHKIENSNGGMELFTWDNGKIVKSELMDSGVITSYKNFQYNTEGNITQVEIYEFMPEINFYAYNIAEVYEYSNGDLKKKVVYQYDHPFNWLITSTHTYESYIDKQNPFQIIEILPTVISQPQLPLSFRNEQNGSNVLNNYTYEFNSQGLPVKRTTTGEVITFSYY